jgi:hypothetical protein
MTCSLVRMVALLLGQGSRTDLLLRQVRVRFPVVSGQMPIAFQQARNEYEIEPPGGRGAHARIRPGDLFLTNEVVSIARDLAKPNRTNGLANRCHESKRKASVRYLAIGLAAAGSRHSACDDTGHRAAWTQTLRCTTDQLQ